jgi:membrane-associated phospholipid phosphatase
VGAYFLLNYSNKEIFIFINSHYSKAADIFFYYATSLGNGFFFVFICFTLLFYKYKHAILAILAFAISSLLAQTVKRTIMEDALRPIAVLGDSYDFHFVEGVDVHSYNSFPSGHATSAFALFLILTLISSKKWLGIVYFCLALAAGYSRVYLGQHFFVDVIWGSLIGVITTLVVYYFGMAYFEKKKYKWAEKYLVLNENV